MEKMRLDKFLSQVLGVSRSQVAHLIEKKMVLVNGNVAEKNGVLIEKSDRVEVLDSANPQNLVKNQAKNAESALDSTNPQNLVKNKSREAQPLASSGVGEGVVREGEGSDFAIRKNPCIQAPTPSLKENARGKKGESKADLSAQRRGEKDSTQNLAIKSNIFIERLYEDNDILVLNKPPFLATHGAPSLKEPSLVEWLKAHKIQRSTISGELREGIVHRLDKQTSGALVVAKNNASHQALSAQLADKTMTRLYLAIIDLPLKEDIEIECYLARNPKNRLKISKVDVRKYKKTAESTLDSANSAPQDAFATDSSQNLPKFARYSKSKFFKLLPSKDGKKELILARLFTGRTHQIRAHLESINRHIIGDELYGYKRGRDENYRVMLHAYLLELRHPKNIIFAESSMRNSSLGASCGDFGNLGHFADFSPVSHPKFPKNSTTSTANTRICDLDSANQMQIAESTLDSAESQNLGENQVKNAESAISKQDANSKLRFIAPLFDDMKDYLAKNFDMEKVNEILRTLPARAF